MVLQLVLQLAKEFKMSKVYIGIDFSINSPAIVIFKDNQYSFCSFTNVHGKNLTKKIPSAFIRHDYLKTNHCIDWNHFVRRSKHDDYSIDQFQKIEDANKLAYQIREYILSFVNDSDSLKIGIEGYAYGSKGNAMIDLIAFNSTLRNNLYRKFKDPKNTIDVFSPSQIKMHAGKGNSNKLAMFDYFVDDVCSDNELIKHNFYKYVNSLEIKPNKKGDKEVPKPLDDIIDAYFICNILREIDTI